MATTMSTATRERLQRTARWLAYATIGWNTIEAVAAISSGAIAGSGALVAFGLDSIVEVGSALVVAWQFGGVSEEREERALELIAVSFFVLAGYVAFTSTKSLISRDAADPSGVGIGIAALSLAVMPVLAAMKRRTATALGSATVKADSQQTMLCTYLSGVLLVGLGLNAWIGWWWADPIAALVIAGVALREGREAWLGEVCCDDGPDRCSA